MRNFLTGLLVLLGLMLQAQHTLIYTHEDILFQQGKDYFNQRKHVASYRSFEEFLQKSDVTRAGQRHEAEFYMAANAYELRQDNAFALIRSFLQKHPYTTFADKANAMMGILLYEQKKYAEALNYFGEDKVKISSFSTREQTELLFCRGYALLETQAYGQALQIFRRLRLQESAYRLDASYYYAYAEYALKNYEAALTEFLKIENEEKYKEKVAYYLVQIYYQLNNYAELNRRSDQIFARYPNNPDNAEIFRIRGEIAYATGNFSQAVEFLKRYESLSSRFLRNDFYLMGISLIKLQRFNAAIPYLQKVTTEKDALTENTYMHLGNAFLKVNDKVNARLAFEAALSTNFDSKVREDALFNYALTTYETTSAFGESISAFEQFLKEFPNSRNANNVKTYLANEYMSTRNYEVAYQSIQKITDPNDKILEARQYILYQLGTEAFASNQFQKAINYFNLSIQNAPTGIFAAESYYWRSESYYRLNQTESSIQDLQTFLRMSNARNNPNFVVAHYNMGYAFFSQKNFKEAKRYFELYVNLERNRNADIFADAINRIGDCLFYERDFRNAEIQYTRAANLSPNTGDYALFQSAYVAGLQKKYTVKISRLNDLIESYPKSEYVDDALYETGRAYLMLNNEREAIKTYRRLLTMLPNSLSARKAALEIGMIFLNQENQKEALAAFKVVIENYTGTPEAFSALEIMESMYVEMNDVPAYMAYLRSINLTMPGGSVNREDSISYIAAEKQYMNTNYQEAINGFRAYLTNFCAGGRYCTVSQYYLADSYYRVKDFHNALIEFDQLLLIPGNPYLEEAAMRCAEITFNNRNFEASLRYFQRFEQLAQTTDKKNTARLGVLRCSYQLQDYPTTISIATDIINDPRSNAEVIAEARYNRAKAYIDTQRSNLALQDVRVLSADTRTLNGAESKYLLAWINFQQGNLATAESEVLDFARKNTPHQYWLARSFVLLSDIYIRQGNDFQAKQYLLSLQRNYTVRDDIQDMITTRLNAISERERANVVG
jgi:tetratricopeptide (TPR) repeat protein